MKILFLAILLVLINAATSVVYACSCMSSGPPCQTYGNTPFVFSAKVVGIETSEANREGIGFKVQQRRVRVAVLESFKGIVGQTAEIVTGQGGGDCGYGFRVNETYLIYAWQGEGAMTTGICSRTRPMSDAYEDLEYLRNRTNASPEGRIYGSVLLHKPRRSDEAWGPNPPLTGIEIRATGPKGAVLTTRTDNQGQFVFENAIPGDYLLTATAQKGLFPDKLERTATLHPKGCSIIDMSFAPETAVTGQLVNERGEPAADIGVNLVPVEQINEPYQKDTQYSHTDSKGEFAFRGIPPGRYYLGVRLTRTADSKFRYPRTFYPGTSRPEDATILTIGEGQVLSGHGFELPEPLAERTIAGSVTFPDGKPAVGASVFTEEIEYASRGTGSGGAVTDAKGQFSIKRPDGLKYRIRVFINMPDGQQRHAEPQEVPTAGDRKGLKFVITEAGGYCERCRM